MARTYLMTWELAKRRWRKMYKGKIYLVSCEGLNAPLYTAEASYRLANEWWKRKEAELRRPDTRTELLTRYQRADLEQSIEKGREAEVLLRAMQSQSLIDAAPVGQEEAQKVILAHLPTERLLEAASQVEGRPVAKDRTIGHQLERYLALEFARGKAPNTYADIDFLLKKALLCPAFKPEMPIDQITAQTVTDLYAWLKNESKLAPNSQKKVFAYFRRFIRFLWGQHLIELPRNLDARIFSFDTQKVVKTYPPEQVRELLAGLKEKLRLYALLALNTAMYSSDMGNLLQSEWQGDRIIRKRTKTRKKENAPTVNYLLWPETLALLQKFKSNDPKYVLTSERGTPLWRLELRGGKLAEANLISYHWGKQSIPLSALRSVAATLLESHKDHGRCTSLFLGHAPLSMKDWHYAAPPQQLFDEAVL